MRHFYIIFVALPISVLLFSCVRVGDGNPYMPDLQRLEISLEVPDGDSADYSLAEISVRDINTDATYPARCDDSGKAFVDVPNGVYMVTVSILNGEQSFNGTRNGVVVSGASSDCAIKLSRLRLSDIVIKEIYSGGCRKSPAEGTYQSDQYVIIHNNGSDVQYLDSLCFGTMIPYNATATNPFLIKGEDGAVALPDFIPIADAVWQFPGDGKTFPLNPGEDAVLCVRGAIDHAATYPLSVNLNKEDYFVLYDANLFPNKTYNPVPGPAIRQERILKCLIKTNPSINATMISIASPTVILYRAKGMSIEEFINSEDGIIPIPGATNGSKVLACPADWIIDAVEVFDGSSSSNQKRLSDDMDAGYAILSSTFNSLSLARRTDTEASEAEGFEVLMDTNNSSADFVELEKQSLRE